MDHVSRPCSLVSPTSVRQPPRPVVSSASWLDAQGRNARTDQVSSWLCLSSLFYSASCGALLEHIHRYLSSTRAHFLVVLCTILGSTHFPRILSLTLGLDTTPLRGRPRHLLLGHDERDALSVRRSTSCLTSTVSHRRALLRQSLGREESCLSNGLPVYTATPAYLVTMGLRLYSVWL